MKKLFPVFFLFFSCISCGAGAGAGNRYVSNSGNDSNDGLTPASAWKTLGKVNRMFSGFAAGDAILFKCNDHFYGSLIADKSGTAGKPIVISSYGSGAKPVISGFTKLSGWTNTGGNIWQCDAAVLKSSVNILTIDGVPYAVGRTPNNDFFTYQSATPTQLTSTQLTDNYVGAQVVIRKASWDGEKGLITAQTGNTITFTRTQAIDNNDPKGAYKGTPGYGFFMQRFAGSLDQFGEWFMDADHQKMKIFSAKNPNDYSINASFVDTVIDLGNKNNITLQNIAVEGGGMYGVFARAGSDITIKKCVFNNNTKAVYAWNITNVVVDGCCINNSFNGGILCSNHQSKRITITNNTVTNTGQLIGMGLFWSGNDLKGIVAETDTSTASNFVKIIGNVVRNTGHSAIEFQGSNVTIRRNVVDTFCNQLDDNGGIYTFVNNSTPNNRIFRNRLIDSNFIMNAIGAPLGAKNEVDVVGYYMDDQTLNVTGLHNTIFNIPGNGVQMNTPSGMIFSDNIVYNCNTAISVNKKHVGEVSNNSITRNVVYQKDSSQLNFYYTNDNLGLPRPVTLAQAIIDIGTIDSNWISNIKRQSYGHYYSETGARFIFPPNMGLSQWQKTFLHDQHSILPPVALTATNTRLVYNTTGVVKKISLDGRYLGVDGKVYDRSISVPPFSSAILISSR